MILAACGRGSAPAPRAAVQYRQLTVGGLARSYRVFSPPTVERSHPAPLVMVLHGGGDNVASVVQTTQFDKQASAGNFVVVYPEGTRLEWNAGFCCGSAPSRNVDDVGFLSAVLDRVEGEYPVDPSRVMVAGISNGAMMAYRYGCEQASRVTAVASVAGAFVLDSCHPSRAVSVIEVHGTQDPLVPFLGGQISAPGAESRAPLPSTQAIAQRWADLDGCSPQPAVTTTPPVTTAAWSGCRNRSALSLVSIDGGGHVWFAPGLGTANGALDVTQVIWRFFDGLQPTG